MALNVVIDNFRKPEIIRQLPKLGKDNIKFVVASGKLAVSSEDEVIESVLRWAEQQPHHLQVSSLADVLECTRYLLLSSDCLDKLSQHHLVRNETRAQAVLTEISQYQSQQHSHRTRCPPAAVQREFGDMNNLLLWGSKAMDLRHMVALNCPPKLSGSTVLCYHPSYYNFCNDGRVVTYLHETKEWLPPVDLGRSGFTLAVGETLYNCDQSCRDVVETYNYKLSHFQREIKSGKTPVQWEHIGYIELASKATRARVCVEGVDPKA